MGRPAPVTEAGESPSCGAYLLELWLGRAQAIQVGRLGCIEFPAGWYLYAGSARGPGGLRARLERHRRRLDGAKRLHWHIDYLRERSALTGAWCRRTDERLECEWAAVLRRLPGSRIVSPGFGASDCGCPAHLVHVDEMPCAGDLASLLEATRLEAGSQPIDDLLGLLRCGDEAGREAAALALGRCGSAAVVPLEALLASEDAGGRWWAARALAEVGGERAVPLLVDELADADPDVRACAALALGRLRAVQAAGALAARLSDSSTFVAEVASDALSLIGEPAIPALAAVLRKPQAHTRLLAVRALERTRSAAAVEALCSALEDESYLVCLHAQQALDTLGVGMVYLRP